MRPGLFAVINILLYGVLAYSASRLKLPSPTPLQSTPDIRQEAIFLTAVTAFGNSMLGIPFWAFIARRTHQRTSLRRLYAACCYSLALPVAMFLVLQLLWQGQWVFYFAHVSWPVWNLLYLALTIFCLCTQAWLCVQTMYSFSHLTLTLPLLWVLVAVYALCPTVNIAWGTVRSVSTAVASIQDKTYDPAVFNSNLRDHETVRISNGTRFPGCTDCWDQKVQASEGEYVDVAIYYHNCSNVLATNTRVRLHVTFASKNVALISAAVWSDNSLSPATGSAVVYILSDQALDLELEDAVWFPNQTQQGQPLPYKQSGQEIENDYGLRLGDVAPGWNSQGSVVVRLVPGKFSSNSNTRLDSQ
jgi:hypothetical protein